MKDLKIDAGTITRTIILVLSLLNIIFQSLGLYTIDIGDSQITNLINDAFVVVSAIWAWWKNNNFTQAALTGQEVTDTLKGAVEGEEMTVTVTSNMEEKPEFEIDEEIYE